MVGDVLRLRQVLGNLLSNAVKYTDKGEIEIRVGLDDMRDNQCRLHFSITDTGPGIPRRRPERRVRGLHATRQCVPRRRHGARPVDRDAARAR